MLQFFFYMDLQCLAKCGSVIRLDECLWPRRRRAARVAVPICTDTASRVVVQTRQYHWRCVVFDVTTGTFPWFVAVRGRYSGVLLGLRTESCAGGAQLDPRCLGRVLDA